MTRGVDTYPAIVGIGAALPERVVTNADLISLTGIDSTPEWIEEHTGIRQRHWVEDGEYASDLAVRAARRAIAMAGVSSENITDLFLSTATPDYPTPNTSSLVHKGLQLPEDCFALDLNAACAGSVRGLSLAADRAIAQQDDKSLLVIGSEITSRGLNPEDRRSVILFGDGAGAAVVRRVPGAMRPVFAGMTRPNFDALNVPAGGLVQAQYGPNDSNRMIHMDGRTVAIHAFDIMTRSARKVAEKANLTSKDSGEIEWDDIDYFVPHQANGLLIDAIRQDLRVPQEKVINTILNQGNTSSASVLIALSEAHKRGHIEPGMHRVLFAAVGAGFVGGAALMDVVLT